MIIFNSLLSHTFPTFSYLPVSYDMLIYVTLRYIMLWYIILCVVRHSMQFTVYHEMVCVLCFVVLCVYMVQITSPR